MHRQQHQILTSRCGRSAGRVVDEVSVVDTDINSSPGFSKIVRLLHNLTKKDVPFSWFTAQKPVFETFKKAFVSKLILALRETHWRAQLEIDALG
jgi:hypothetical protein